MKLIFKNILYKSLIYSLLLISLNSCSGRISNHGVLNIENKIHTIIERELEKAEVEALFGPPSTVSAFEFNKWYYINSKIKHFAFYKPEIIHHKVYEIVFNSDNQVLEVNIYDEEDFNKIEFNQEFTDTKGNTKTLLESVFKSFGRNSITN